jgi:hypothetical protein
MGQETRWVREVANDTSEFITGAALFLFYSDPKSKKKKKQKQRGKASPIYMVGEINDDNLITGRNGR